MSLTNELNLCVTVLHAMNEFCDILGPVLRHVLRHMVLRHLKECHIYPGHGYKTVTQLYLRLLCNEGMKHIFGIPL